jgi:hypothetical protein
MLAAIGVLPSGACDWLTPLLYRCAAYCDEPAGFVRHVHTDNADQPAAAPDLPLWSALGPGSPDAYALVLTVIPRSPDGRTISTTISKIKA